MPRKKIRRHARQHGQGSIRELSNGKVRAWKPPENGTRRSLTFAGADARVRAERWLAGYVDPEGLKLGLYLEDWYAAREATLSGQTRTGYLAALAHLEALSERLLAEITVLEWQAWLGRLLDAGTLCWAWQDGRRILTGERRPMAVSSVRQIRSVLSAALNDAVPEHLAFNLLKRTRLPTSPPAPAKAWSASEARRLLAAARGTRDEAMYHVGLAVGPRLGEFRELRWTDLDVAAGTLTIARSLSDNGKVIGPTKTRKARTVTLPAETLAVLLEHQKRQPAGAELMFGNGSRAYSAVEHRRMLRHVCISAGITLLSPHSLRHSAASIQLADRVSAPEVARMLGHTVAVLLKVYSHFISDDASRSVAAARAALYGRRSMPPGVPLTCTPFV